MKIKNIIQALKEFFNPEDEREILREIQSDEQLKDIRQNRAE